MHAQLEKISVLDSSHVVSALARATSSPWRGFAEMRGECECPGHKVQGSKAQSGEKLSEAPGAALSSCAASYLRSAVIRSFSFALSIWGGTAPPAGRRSDCEGCAFRDTGADRKSVV